MPAVAAVAALTAAVSSHTIFLRRERRGLAEVPTRTPESQTQSGLLPRRRLIPCESSERLCHNGILVLFILTRNQKGLL